jgi:hypothetical protein
LLIRLALWSLVFPGFGWCLGVNGPKFGPKFIGIHSIPRKGAQRGISRFVWPHAGLQTFVDLTIEVIRSASSSSGRLPWTETPSGAKVQSGEGPQQCWSSPSNRVCSSASRLSY